MKTLSSSNLSNNKALEKSIQHKLQDRSDLVQEIISRKPDFIEKWAILIFTSILIILLASLWFVKYPDIIESRAVLTAENAPKEIIPRQDGRVVKIFRQNDDTVKKNEVFAWLESTANHEDVLLLSRHIDTCLTLLSQKRLNIRYAFDKEYKNLGELQPAYQTFTTALNLYKDYLVNGFYYRKRDLLKNDISTLEKIKQSIEKQKGLAVQDLDIAEQSFNMNKSLYDEKIMSSEEYRLEKSKYVNKQMAVPQIEASILSNETAEREKLKEIDELNHDISEETIIFQQALQSLKSAIDDWKKRYVITSPIDGKLNFLVPLQENKFLNQGALIGYVNPQDSHIYMETNLSQNNFGKLKPGLEVQLRFDAYPYQEAGFVEGTLQYISDIPSDSGFLATIRLKNGLMTNNKKLIYYKSGLRAQAVIITKNMRFLERLYYNFAKSASVGK